MSKVNRFWNFSKKDEQTGELYLYGDIASSSWYEDDITPLQFKADLDALGDVSTLNVYVNSGGGDVFAGFAIINMLQRFPARKVGYNDGLAASIAFEILMAMDEVVSMENALFMCHNCWTVAVGNRYELAKQIEQMEQIDNMLAELTAKRTCKKKDEIVALMDAETWFTAQEAMDNGIADSIYESVPIAACCTSEMLARYKNAPATLAALDNTEPPCEEKNDSAAEEAAPIEPANGGESQPVEDIPPVLDEQRKHFNTIKRKILGGNNE